MSVSQYKKYIWLVDTIRANRRLNKEQIDRKWRNWRIKVKNSAFYLGVSTDF